MRGYNSETDPYDLSLTSSASPELRCDCGKQAFSGETVASVLATVMMKEPNWTALPANTPATIRNVLARCLKKGVRQRLQAVSEARIAIEEAERGKQEVVSDAMISSEKAVSRVRHPASFAHIPAM